MPGYFLHVKYDTAGNGPAKRLSAALLFKNYLK